MSSQNSGHDGHSAEAPLELSRAERRRAAAQRVVDGVPQEGVAIFRPVEKAVLIGLQRPDSSGALPRAPSTSAAHNVDASLDELEQLVETAGSVTVGRMVQRRDAPDVATFVGRGKVAELQSLTAGLGADAAIFDDELSPAQQRNLEERLGVKVLDRTIVILDIFAQHASSREGRAQVELAQLTYLLPRLRGWGKALSQQAGGIGTRGPGETQLEVDRRKLNRRITKLRRDLQTYERTRRLKASDRERRGVPIIALVGYTNAGKSTLLNRLTGANVLVADQLFATLETTARRLDLPDGREAVATDTVGFVRKLPTQLVEAFKSTLEDTLRADLLLHVVDAAHPEAEMQAAAVDQVLDEIGATTMPRLVVLNKADLADQDGLVGLQRRLGDAIAVSARTGEGIEALLVSAASRIPADRQFIEALVPYDRADLVARAHREGEVLKSESRPEGTWIVAKVARGTLAAFAPYRNGSAPQNSQRH